MIVYARVVESQSFTAAAVVLNMPKSTISRRITQLEESLGVRLLERTTRQLNMTEIGHVYYQHCQRIIEEAALANSHAESLNATPKGLLKISTSLCIGQNLIAPYIPHFLLDHTELKIQLLPTNRMVDIIHEDFDIAIRAGDLKDSTLVSQLLGISTLNLYASQQYINKFGNPENVEDIINHQCIVMSSQNNSNHWKLFNNKEAISVKINPRAYVHDFSIIKSMINNGAGIGILPDYLIKPEDINLIKVLPSYCKDKVPINMVYPSRLGATAKLKCFIKFFKLKLKDKLSLV